MLKNRYGDSEKVVPVSFYGKVNRAKELPELTGDDDSNIDYSIFNNPMWVAKKTESTPTIQKGFFL